MESFILLGAGVNEDTHPRLLAISDFHRIYVEKDGGLGQGPPRDVGGEQVPA